VGRLNDRRCTLFMGVFVICMGKCYYNGTATFYTATFFYTVGKSLYSGGIVGFSWVTVGRSVVGSLFHNLLSFRCEILSIIFEFLSVSLFLLSSRLIDLWAVRFKRKTLLATRFNLWQFVFISGNSF
jgi:hypothetical protein